MYGFLLEPHGVNVIVAYAFCVTDQQYRPETCCIIANYYSMKSEHERAVLYFKRALQLDPNYLAAWTLLVRCLHMSGFTCSPA